MQFSPDGRHIAAIIGFQLAIVDVASGRAWTPRYASNGAIHPRWGPDNRTLLYERGIVGLSTPPESTGFRLLDVVSGSETQLLANGAPLFGSEVVWPPRGDSLMLIRQAPGDFDDELVSYRIPDGMVTVFGPARPGTTYRSLRWYDRQALGLSGAVFVRTSLPASGGIYYLPNSGGPSRTFPYSTLPSAVFSPDGEKIITLATSLTDSNTVLFLRDIDDRAGVTYRQLTYWSPPATN